MQFYSSIFQLYCSKVRRKKKILEVSSNIVLCCKHSSLLSYPKHTVEKYTLNGLDSCRGRSRCTAQRP